jgi:MOSC domain-containing protein YiiM
MCEISVRLVFCSESHYNCGLTADFIPIFTGTDRHSKLHHSGVQKAVYLFAAVQAKGYDVVIGY